MSVDTITAIKKALEGVKIEKWAARPDYLDSRVWEVYPPRNGPPENGVWSELFVCADQYGKKNEAKANARYLKAVNPVTISELLSTLESLQRENEELRSELKNADALIDAQNQDHASNNIRYAENANRAEAAEAEVKRLREAETLETYYERQIEWSRVTFGHALRTKGIIDHIKKELREIESDPHDLSEWVDVVILAMDGFWRHGGSPGDLFKALIAKQQKNMARTWPDWRTMSEDSAIEHDRSKDALASTGGEHHAE